MKASALAALVVIAILITLPVDVPKTFGIKGDESTYVAMALSLAYDGDLKFRQEDLQRFEQIYGIGPEGIFLKQGYRLQVVLSAGWPPIRIEKTRRPARQGLDFGKPFIYSAVAAPFVRIAGVRGLLILNLLLAVAVLWMAVRFASRRMSAPAAIVVSLAFVGASIAGLYTVWLTSEFFNFALVFAGFFFWLFKEVVEPAEQTPGSWLYGWKTDLIAAFLFGLATFSKPPNALLVAPLILTLAVRRRWRGAALTCVVFLVASAGTFAVNGLVAGEMNYQGGDRRTFYGRFPYGDPTITFDRLGQAMVTEDTDAESLFAPNVMFPLLGHNVVYFVVGRHAGLIPYFFPGVAILAAWALRPGRWRRWQTFSVLTLGASVFVMLVLIPYSWNGGGGPPGNRYFLSLYPGTLLPSSRYTWRVAARALDLSGSPCRRTAVPASPGGVPTALAQRRARHRPLVAGRVDDGRRPAGPAGTSGANSFRRESIDLDLSAGREHVLARGAGVLGGGQRTNGHHRAHGDCRRKGEVRSALRRSQSRLAENGIRARLSGSAAAGDGDDHARRGSRRGLYPRKSRLRPDHCDRSRIRAARRGAWLERRPVPGGLRRTGLHTAVGASVSGGASSARRHLRSRTA